MTIQALNLESEAPPSGAAPQEWDEPIPFDDFELPVFPEHVLPQWLGDWCEEEAQAIQVPVDLPALLGLAVVSLCASKKLVVEVKPGWREHLALYVAVAMASGEGKSPPFMHATAPLHKWERDQKAIVAPQRADAEEQRRLLEERLRELRKVAAATKTRNTDAGENAAEEARALAVELDEVRVPALPRLLAGDATAEAVGRLLAEQGGRLGIFSDEGGPLAIMAGRYNEGRANIELFCQAHTGAPYNLDRVGRESIQLRAPLLTIALTVQPSVISGLAESPALRNQGLLARFLYAMPKSLVGRRIADTEPMSDFTREQYEKAIGRLLDLEAETEEDGELVPRVLTLDQSARERLLRFKAEIEPRIGPGGDLQPLADWCNKLPGITARLAGVLHVAAEAGDETVEVSSMTTSIHPVFMGRAVSVARYAIEHARAVFSLMGSDAATAAAKRAWSWIAAKGVATVSQRDLHRGLHAERATDLDAPIKLLVERGYLREVPVAASGGRPPSPTYAVNPRAKR